MGVRYVVVAERIAPAPFATEARPAPPGFTATLDAQLDLEPLDVPAGLRVYRNQAFFPERAAAPWPRRRRPRAASPPPPSSTSPPLPAVLPDESGHLRWKGEVADGSYVLLSASHSEDWQLVVDGRSAERQKPFGWAMGFPVEEGGDGDAPVPDVAPSLRLPPRAGPGLAPRTAGSHPHPAGVARRRDDRPVAVDW